MSWNRLSPITLFVDFAILIVMCPLMSFIKGLVMVQGFHAMLLQSPPLPTMDHKFHNFHNFQKN